MPGGFRLQTLQKASRRRGADRSGGAGYVPERCRLRTACSLNAPPLRAPTRKHQLSVTGGGAIATSCSVRPAGWGWQVDASGAAASAV